MRLNMKITIFWDMTPCSFVDVYHRSEKGWCLHSQDSHTYTLKMEESLPRRQLIFIVTPRES
jgi:hypothetical protein